MKIAPALFKNMNISFNVEAAVYDGNRLVSRTGCSAGEGETELSLEEASWRCSISMETQGGIIDGETCFVLAKGTVPCGNVAISLSFSGWSERNYVLIPAAVYNGNRFRIARKRYPPFLHDADGIGADMAVTIADVPHLAVGNGPSAIHMRSGDMATPAVGIYLPETSKGFLLLFEHNTALGYTGVQFAESEDRKRANLRIEAPAIREKRYAMTQTDAPNDDRGASFIKGDKIALRFRAVLFDCADIPGLFDAFFNRRKDICGSYDLVHGLPLSAAYRIIEKKFNESQFNKEFGYYMLSPTGTLLIRKNGDVLLFAIRQILLTQRRGQETPTRWLFGIQKLADAFVRVWHRHGQFGQFIDIDTEEILQGGTACGSIIPGGLALAWKLFGDEKYLLLCCN